MLLSMTGYGRVSERFKEKTIMVELRALNSKYADIRMKIPQNFRDKEPDIRRLLSEHAERGKLDFSLDVKSIHGDEEYSLNTSLFRKYHRELRKLSGELEMPEGDLLQAILKLPNVVAPEEDYIDEEEWEAVKQTIEEALEKFRQYLQ